MWKMHPKMCLEITVRYSAKYHEVFFDVLKTKKTHIFQEIGIPEIHV